MNIQVMCLLLVAASFPAAANFDYKASITLEQQGQRHYFEAFLEANEWGAAVSGNCKFLAKITPDSLGNVELTGSVTCNEKGGPSSLALPTLTLSTNDGKNARMKVNTENGATWRYSVTLTSPSI
ncbi:hypothetical protein CW749_15270 [Vibrio sp. vnigr-6D03]|uniref:hypothetical protein n=1 Tax=Vibrio sp. vnigr-6D03 TaxID=2058088 RepID=UPI000C3410E5|nr:hypothetical protein [Vibrio sp. vnigr-6D03]PKF78438.1 hypothetical protein CW749_15270 [Vibrio sp. vnigr-6D03]